MGKREQKAFDGTRHMRRNYGHPAVHGYLSLVSFGLEARSWSVLVEGVRSHCYLCVVERLVSRPHLLGESAQGILLLNLGEVEG